MGVGGLRSGIDESQMEENLGLCYLCLPSLMISCWYLTGSQEVGFAYHPGRSGPSNAKLVLSGHPCIVFLRHSVLFRGNSGWLKLLPITVWDWTVAQLDLL